MTTRTITLTLFKHHGLGNDFLVVFHPGIDDLSALARSLCDRRRGVGADGLLIAESAEGFAAQMVLYNADGSRAEMSGNGILCFAQALANQRGSLSPQTILTDAGPRLVTLTATDDPEVVEGAVDMGEVLELREPTNWAAIACDPLRPVAHLSVGNPHSVVAVDSVDTLDLPVLGALVPHVNLEVVSAGPEENAITMRVHERGAGITDACGTGACASAWAADQWGLVPAGAKEIVVHMPGGDAKVRLHQPAAGRVTLVGPATYVASVTVDFRP